MESNLIKLSTKAGLAILKSAALLLLSSALAGELRSESVKATQKVSQVFKFAQNKIIARKIKSA